MVHTFLVVATNAACSAENIGPLRQPMVFVGSPPGPRLALGDVNASPELLQDWAHEAHGALLAAGVPTFVGREINFGICSAVLEPLVESALPTEGAA